MDRVRDTEKRVERELEELLMIGPSRSQDTGKITSWKAGYMLPWNDLRSRFGHVVIITNAGTGLGGLRRRFSTGRMPQALKEHVFGVYLLCLVGEVGESLDMGGIVEDEGGSIARPVDNERDGYEVFIVDAGHGCRCVGRRPPYMMRHALITPVVTMKALFAGKGHEMSLRRVSQAVLL